MSGGGTPIDVTGGTSFSELRTAYISSGGWSTPNTWASPSNISLSLLANKTFSTGPAVPAASVGGGDGNINIKGFRYWAIGDPWGVSSSGVRTFNSEQGPIPPESDSGSDG